MSVSHVMLTAKKNHGTFLVALHSKQLLYTHCMSALGQCGDSAPKTCGNQLPLLCISVDIWIPFLASSASAWQRKKWVGKASGGLSTSWADWKVAHSASAYTHWPELSHMAIANCDTVTQ